LRGAIDRDFAAEFSLNTRASIAPKDRQRFSKLMERAARAFEGKLKDPDLPGSDILASLQMLDAPRAETRVCERLGDDIWRFRFDGEESYVAGLDACGVIALLLEAPNRALAYSELEEIDPNVVIDHREARRRGVLGDGTGGAGTAEPVPIGRTLDGARDSKMDEKALAELQRKITELTEELEEHRALGKSEDADRVESELATLVDFKRKASTLGGRSRSFDDSSERARKRLGAGLKRVFDTLRARSPSLAAHFRASIKARGDHAIYLADPGPTWVIKR
jgi:hypothetical protein